MAIIQELRGVTPTVGEGTFLAENAALIGSVKMGKDCSIWYGAVLRGDVGPITLGDRVNIQDGAVLHATTDVSEVIIGNNVDIGSNTCIDRGTIDDTIIEDGVKIDNLCHIAHNVVIGKNSCIIAASTIAGSVKIGEGSYVAIGASILNQTTIGEEALIGMGAVVTKDIPAEMVCAYSPAKVIRKRTQKDKEKY